MAFRFPLKALHRIRAIYERRERQRLELITHRLVLAQNQLVTLRKDQLEKAGSLAKSLGKGMTAAELQFQIACSVVRLRRIDAVAQVVESVTQQHKKQLIEYRQARQKLEVMERLFERQLLAYRKTQERRDQQQATDLFLIRSEAGDDRPKLPGHSANLTPEDGE
jgi:flagellar export protein FliJ